MCFLMDKLYKFLEKGNNKRIFKIVDAVIIGILSVLSLYFVFNILSADTMDKYWQHVLKQFLFLLIVGGADFLLIIFTKPLFGFTSFFENREAKKRIKAREKAVKADEKAAQKTAKASK